MKRALVAMFAFSLMCCASVQVRAEGAQAPDKPIQLKSSSSSKMWVTFNHASHEGMDCEVCHHMMPSDADTPYVSCGASEECHNIKGSKERDVQSLFWAYHTKSAERSCYGCHHVMVNPGCRPCHMSPQAREAAEKSGK